MMEEQRLELSNRSRTGQHLGRAGRRWKGATVHDRVGPTRPETSGARKARVSVGGLGLRDGLTAAGRGDDDGNSREAGNRSAGRGPRGRFWGGGREKIPTKTNGPGRVWA